MGCVVYLYHMHGRCTIPWMYKNRVEQEGACHDECNRINPTAILMLCSPCTPCNLTQVSFYHSVRQAFAISASATRKRERRRISTWPPLERRPGTGRSAFCLIMRFGEAQMCRNRNALHNVQIGSELAWSVLECFDYVYWIRYVGIGGAWSTLSRFTGTVVRQQGQNMGVMINQGLLSVGIS